MADATEIARLYNSLVQSVRRGTDVPPFDLVVPDVQHSETTIFPDGSRRVKTGIIAGAFGVIHPGYIKAFKEAKQYCERLVVAVHADPSTEHPEKHRPVLTVMERTEILESIRYVDEVLFYGSEKDLYYILQIINPDIRFLGRDYDMGIKAITGSELNIPIHYLDRSHGWSATKFEKMICKSLENS